jgi:predicted transposase/invertase (TIGR01784 family)
MTSSSPHDAIFKATFERADLARSELELVLPAEVKAHLDLATLEVQAGSYRDRDLLHTESDLLYAVRTREGGQALVYVLYEHQSSFDAKMAFRILKYMVRIWERWLADHEHAKTLPIILPVLLHHGEGTWRAAPEFASTLDASPELLEATRPYQPHFQFVLDDLSALSLDALGARSLEALARLTQISLWSSRSLGRLQSAVPVMAAIHRALARDERTRALLFQIYTYVLQAAPADVAAADIRSILLQVAGPEGAEDVMNAAQQLIEQGRAEGRADGLEQGEAKGLRVAIAHVLTARKLALSEFGRARLASCSDLSMLTAWLDRATTATSEAEVFAGAEGT